LEIDFIIFNAVNINIIRKNFLTFFAAGMVAVHYFDHRGNIPVIKYYIL